jgi:ubiquinone/menaquinone biosynthesis C-methylase UbiE
MLVQKDGSTRSVVVGQDDYIELERLSNSTLLVKHSLGGLLPGSSSEDIAHVHNVLEIGCGPGAWSLEMAQVYYGQMRVVGVDNNPLMVAQANIQAQARQLDNIRHFHAQDLTGPFACADSSFDLISAQFLSKVLYKDSWPQLLRECWRLLRPGGLVRLTDYEVGESNSPAHEELWTLFLQAMRRTGRSFSPTDRHLGLLCELEPLVFQAGFRETHSLAHVINYSSGAPLHEEWKKDFLMLARGVQSFLIDAGVCTFQHLQDLYARQQIELGLRNFHAVLPMLTVWGKK